MASCWVHSGLKKGACLFAEDSYCVRLLLGLKPLAASLLAGTTVSTGRATFMARLAVSRFFEERISAEIGLDGDSGFRGGGCRRETRDGKLGYAYKKHSEEEDSFHACGV